MAFAETIAREEDLVIPDETSASMPAISEWINANQRANPDFSPEVENKAVFRGIIGLL